MSVTKGTSLNGQQVMIWIGEKVVALSTNCTIQYNTNMVDGATKDDGDMDNQEPGTLGWTVTNDFLLTGDARSSDLDFDALVDLWLAKGTVDVTIGKPTNWNAQGLEAAAAAWAKPTTGIKTGKAYITSMQENHQKGQKSTGSLTLTGAGALTHVS